MGLLPVRRYPSLFQPLTIHVLRDHVFLGGIVALLLPNYHPQERFLFWAANVLIDVDHYLDFLLRTRFKTLRIGAMFRFHEFGFARRNQREFVGVEIFHTIEFQLLFAGITFYLAPSLAPVFWGMLFHNAVDLVHLARWGVFRKRAHSLVEYFWRRKKLFQKGVNPDLIFIEMEESLDLRR